MTRGDFVDGDRKTSLVELMIKIKQASANTLKAVRRRLSAAPYWTGYRFIEQRSGSVAVEFALIGLVSLELVTEAMQAGLYFYSSAAVERATTAASRAILTGSVANQGLNAAQFRTTVVCPSLTSLGLSCGNIITNIQTVPEAVSPGGFYTLLNSAQTKLLLPASMDNTKTSFCIGGTGSYVYVQVFYALPVISPIWRLNATTWNGTSSYFIQSTAVFKNEPFQTASSGTC